MSWNYLVKKRKWSISYGAFERNTGTLLIDQVSEIPLDIQSKILRVLTDQKFKRVNGSNDVSVDVRLICSSSKDLKKEIKLKFWEIYFTESMLLK